MAVTESEGNPSVARHVRMELAVSIKSAAKSLARTVKQVKPANQRARQMQILRVKI
jgi:hypothetical protein